MQATGKATQDAAHLSHLIAGADGRSLRATGDDLKATLQEIVHVILTHKSDTEALAKHLYSSNPLTAASNVWDFMRSYLHYKLDKAGYEQIRTPARSWRDRRIGVDCEDMAIFSATVLMNMGYKPHLVIVAFNGLDSYGHIYTILGDIVIDGVMPRFNIHPPHITKTMKIDILSGVSGIDGLGIDPMTVAKASSTRPGPQSATTKKMVAIRSNLLEQSKSMAADEKKHLAKEVRKINYGIAFNDSPYQEKYTAIMPLVDDIDESGNLQFHSNADIEVVAAYLDDELTYSEFSEYSSEFSGSSFLSGTDEELGNIFKKAGALIKKATGGIKKTLGKVAHAINKVNPVTFAARNAFLVALKLNLFWMASRLALGYKTSVTGDKAEHQKLKDKMPKVEKLYFNLGGKIDKFKEAIAKGSKRKPPMTKKGKYGLKGYPIIPANDEHHYDRGSSNFYQMDYVGNRSWTQQSPYTHVLSGIDAENTDIDHLLGELGEPASATAIITAAGAVLTAVGAILKSINFKKIDKDGEVIDGEEIPDEIDGSVSFDDDTLTDEDREAMNNLNDDDSSSSTGTMMMVGGAALIGYALLSPKSSKS